MPIPGSRAGHVGGAHGTTYGLSGGRSVVGGFSGAGDGCEEAPEGDVVPPSAVAPALSGSATVTVLTAAVPTGCPFSPICARSFKTPISFVTCVTAKRC